MLHTKRPFLLVILILSCLSAQAQRGWEVGGWAGLSYYFGDLNTRFDIAHPGPGAGAIARYNFNSRLSARLGLNYGNVRADDAWSSNAFEQRRNLRFNSHILEGLMQFEFNFLPYVHGSRDKFFTPYIFGGASAFSFSPRAKYDGEWVTLQSLGTEGQFLNEEYSRTQVSLVYGLGLKWDLTADWSMNLEISSRYTFTDYIDDVSATYPDFEDLEELRGPTAVALSDPSIPDAEGVRMGETGRLRGDSTTKDYFSFIGISLLYYFGNLKCPVNF